jgi:alpha-1,2-mannosyltransferase
MVLPAAGPSRSRLWFYLALGLLFAAVGVQYSVKVLTPRPDGNTQSAILRWSKQIQAMEEGENIHAKQYPNPPIVPQMLWPLAKLAEGSPLAAALTWFFLKIGMAILCLVWAFRLIETPGQPYPEWARAVAVLAAINPIIGDLKHGNINLFILFLVMAGLYAFSRGKDFAGGLLVALAIASKVTPALFVVYFARKLAWRVLAGIGVGLVLFFFVVPSAVFAVQKGSVVEGCRQNATALNSWVEEMIVPFLVHGKVTPERENQSLPGVLTRLLSHQPSASKWVDGQYTPLAYHNVADLDKESIRWILRGCQAVFVVLIIALCRAPIRGGPRHGWRLAAEYSLVMVGMLIFSERTWKHHCVMLVLPFAVVTYGAFAGAFSRTVRLAARMSLLTAVVAVLLPTVTEMFGNDPNSPRELVQVYGAYLWGMLALLGGLVAMLASAATGSRQT